MIPLALDWACLGYLRSPSGRLRYIQGLDIIARDIETAGLSVAWCELRGDCPAVYQTQARRILLAPWLFWAPPWFLRLCAAHELGHAHRLWDDDRAFAWARRHYPDLWAAG